MIYILLRNDDPCARSDPRKERRVLELFERYHAPQVLAVIPNNVEDPHVWHKGDFLPLQENPAMIDLLKEYAKKGLVEIAQHGYTHQTNQFRPSIQDEITADKFYQGIDRKWAAYQPAHENEYSEFNGLPVEEQRDKVVKGQAYLEKIFGVKLKSFIFPWNTYNQDVLKILKRQGFQFVPCEDDLYILPGLDLIGSCHWDWKIDQFREQIKEMEQKNKSVLTQFGYHSWAMTEETMAQIEGLLQELSGKPDIKFILPRQIPEVVPWVRRIIPLRCRMLRLEKELNPFMQQEIYSPKYYVNDAAYYLKRIVKLSLSLFVLKYLGLKRLELFLVFMSGLFIPLLLLRYHLDLIGWVDLMMISIVGLLGVGYFVVIRRTNFKRA